MRTGHRFSALLVGLIALTVMLAHAQTPLRVRGIITAVDGSVRLVSGGRAP